jgi:hypothetical protein
MNTFKQNKQWEQNIKALPVEDNTWIVEQQKEEAEAMAELQAPGDVWTKISYESLGLM